MPVYFHVVHAGGVGNISQKVIDEQMKVLNAAFAGFYGGASTGFSFKLAGVTRTDNAAWHYAGPTTKEERDMKRALHRGGWNALNLYATTAGGYVGWAYFPGLPDAQQYLDGIVVDWESLPGASSRYANKYDLGHTATHEAGHWIHLHHVFNGGCNNWGDYVDDTPPQSVATFGCPVGQDSCREPGVDSIHNYMDYSYDACYNQFTKARSRGCRTPGSTTARSGYKQQELGRAPKGALPFSPVDADKPPPEPGFGRAGGSPNTGRL